MILLSVNPATGKVSAGTYTGTLYFPNNTNNAVTVLNTTSNTNAVRNGKYVVSNTSGNCPITLPTGAAIGDKVSVIGNASGSASWQVKQNASQVIRFNSSSTTTGTGGSLQSTNGYNCVELMCVSSDGNTWVATSVNGTLTVT